MIWLVVSPSAQACSSVSGGVFIRCSKAAISPAFQPARPACQTPSQISAASAGMAMMVRTGKGRKCMTPVYPR